ncbi:hypothetical protein ACFX15_013225 [Malus domestica]
MERLLAHWYTISKQPNSGVNLVEFLAEGDNGPVLSLDKIQAAPAALEDHRPQVKDPLEEINVGTADDPRPLFISALLPQQMKDELRALLTEFKDCFAWSYHEMPGLDRTLVEHELRIKPGCKPFRQPPRRFSTEVQLSIKDELVRLLKAGFIRTARYVEWLANIVPVLKKSGALRICIDFRNLNLATPKDEYTMPISDLLIDAAANHEMLSFMDGHAGYNQIFIAEADVHKTAFRCPGALGTYEWVVMPFGLKNAGATYQRAMNTIFHDLIGTIVEVYIDDVVIKSKRRRTHLDDLRQAFLRMRQHNLKMNPAKCAFGVSAGNFLGFLVHHRGIEVDANKARAIVDAPPPTTKKQLQSLLGQINFLRRFIANSAGKMKAFSTLLKLKDSDKFVWNGEHEAAFTQIKVSLTKPPVIVPPRRGKPLKLYISAAEESIGCLLAQDNDAGREQAIFYLSRNLNQPEINYPAVEKLCLAVFFAASKLRHYMLPSVTQVIAQTDVIRYMLTRPIVKGRIGKWTMALSEFSLQYVPQKAVKGQALADFLAQHPSPYGFGDADVEIGMVVTRDNYWTMYFDGSSTSSSAGVGIVIQSPHNDRWYFSLKLDFECTNNQAEYEALVIGLGLLLDLRATRALVLGDSELVINQINGSFRCMSCTLAPYHMVASYLAESFDGITFEHISRVHNTDADELAQIASGAQLMGGKLGREIPILRQLYPALVNQQILRRDNVIRTRVMSLPSLLDRQDSIEICAAEAIPDDWRKPIMQYLDNPNGTHSRRTRVHAMNYVTYQNELYRKGEDGLLLLCLGPQESARAIAEVHEGVCGAHQSGRKMRWLLRRHGYFWPKILKDCIEFARGCVQCQIHGPIQRVPAESLHSVIKPWPFRGWAMDVIGKITPTSGAAKHAWIIVATDYFTKWVEAKSYAELTSKEVCDFVEEHIVTRFGVPETIITDNGTIFTAERFKEYTANLNIRLEQSTPYYPQANGQAEASNKVLIGILEKIIKDRPGMWHLKLNEALWAYRTSPRSATATTPYALTYGHDAVLPVELSINSLRLIEQSSLFSAEYNQSMRQELEDLEEARLDAYNLLVAQKQIAERAYNQKVQQKTFGEGELVWQTVLPVGLKDPRFGKWSPNWEGPFIVHKVYGKGAYHLKDRTGVVHKLPINGKFLKKYYPVTWEMRE